MKGFPHETPNPSYTTDFAPGLLPILGPSTILGTAPAIKGGDVPKMIVASVLIIWPDSPEQIAITCERDGTPLQATYGQENHSTIMTQAYTYHWVDETPGKGAPVYTVTAAPVAGTAAATQRRVTVFNL